MTFQEIHRCWFLQSEISTWDDFPPDLDRRFQEKKSELAESLRQRGWTLHLEGEPCIELGPGLQVKPAEGGRFRKRDIESLSAENFSNLQRVVSPLKEVVSLRDILVALPAALEQFKREYERHIESLRAAHARAEVDEALSNAREFYKLNESALPSAARREMLGTEQQILQAGFNSARSENEAEHFRQELLEFFRGHREAKESQLKNRLQQWEDEFIHVDEYQKSLAALRQAATLEAVERARKEINSLLRQHGDHLKKEAPSEAAAAFDAVLQSNFPPALPGGLHATSANANGISILWDKSSGAAQYRVYRGDSRAVESRSFLSSVEASAGSNPGYLDASAEAGKEYFYWVAAKNAKAESDCAGPVPGKRSAKEAEPVEDTPTAFFTRALDADKEGKVREIIEIYLANPSQFETWLSLLKTAWRKLSKDLDAKIDSMSLEELSALCREHEDIEGKLQDLRQRDPRRIARITDFLAKNSEVLDTIDARKKTLQSPRARRVESEDSAQASEAARLKAEAEQKARQEAEARQMAEEAAKAAAEARNRDAARLKAEAEQKARQEAEARTREAARLKAEEEQKARQEAEARQIAEEAAKAAAEAKNREAARLKAEAEQKARQEAEAKRIAEEAAKAAAEARTREAARLKAEEEQKARQEAETRRISEEAAKAAAEARNREAARLRAEAAEKAAQQASTRPSSTERKAPVQVEPAAQELKPRQHWRAGCSKADKGDLDGAIADYTKAIDQQPDFVDAYLDRAAVKHYKGDLDGAIADYTKAIALQPDSVHAYINRGRVRNAKGDLDGEIADCTRAITLQPDYALAYIKRGEAKKAKGDMEGYEADSLKARALEAEQEARQKHATTRTEGEKPKPALEPAKPRKSRLFMMALAAYVLLVPVVWYVGLEVRKHWIGPEHPKITPEMLFPQAGQPWTNSLGLKFVPVAGTEVLFGVWDVRVKDFAGFARDTAGNGGWDYRKGQEPVILRSDGWKPRGWEYGWQNPGFPQSDECPVTCVSWEDAKAFCKWLTDKERSAGSLAANQSYRLPTDSEWSTAVGPQKFPWGDTMPPPDRAGNYAGSEAANTDWPADYSTLKGHHDAYARTSPVGSLLPNRFGLFDMGGNVWQWCEDWYRKEMNGAGAQGDGGGKRDRVLRGAAWSIYNPVNLSSGYRGREEPGGRSVENGFRCVLEMGGAAR